MTALPEKMSLAFLLYVSRSGSTMLANHIARRMPKVLVFPEVDFVGDLFARGDEVVCSLDAAGLVRLLRRDPKLADLQLSDSQLVAWVEQAAGGNVHDVLGHLALAYARHLGRDAPNVVLFQRGTLLSVAPHICDSVSGARFLHIGRDPRAVINSVIQVNTADMGRYDRRAMGRADVVGLARNWRRYTGRVATMARDAAGATLDLSYEAVCADLESTLARIADHLSVELGATSTALKIDVAQNVLHKNIDRPPLMERIHGWRQELAPWRGYLVEQVAGDAMAARGYELTYSSQLSYGQRVIASGRGWTEFVFASVRPLARRLRQIVVSPRANARVVGRRVREHRVGKP